MDNTYTFSYFLGTLFTGCPVCADNYMSVAFIAGNTTTYKGNDGAGDNIWIGSYYDDANNAPEHTFDNAKLTGVSNRCIITDGNGKIGNATLATNKFTENCVKSVAYLN